MKYIQNICVNCSHYKKCKEPCAFIEKLLNESEGLCDSCPHKSTCTKPCFLAKAFINENTKALFEKTKIEVKDGQEYYVTTIYSENDKKISAIADVAKNEDESPLEYKGSQEIENFWDGVYYVRSKKLGIFIDRFFNNWSLQDLAEKYDMTPKKASDVYESAKIQMAVFIDAWNHENKMLRGRKISEARTKNKDELNKSLKAFLLHHCLDFTYNDIAEILGYSDLDNVGADIRRVRKKIKQGVTVIKFDEDLNPRSPSRYETKIEKQRIRNENCQMV
jgi:hypothetical protein